MTMDEVCAYLRVHRATIDRLVQILPALHQAESGERVADICREHGVSEATFYVYGPPCVNKDLILR